MAYDARIESLRHVVNKFYDDVDGRVNLIENHVKGLKQKVALVRSKIDQLKSSEQKSRATRFISAASYPLEHDQQGIDLEPISFKGQILEDDLREIRELLNPLKPQPINRSLNSVEEFDQHERRVSTQIERVNNFRAWRERGDRSPLSLGFDASSLLVFQTNESRLIAQSNSQLSYIKSNESDVTSFRDYASQDLLARSLRHYKGNLISQTINGTSEDGPIEQDLGPVPESIMKYHQDSMVNPGMTYYDSSSASEHELDNNPADSSWNLVTGDLPEVLPSLLHVARDVTGSAIKRDRKAHDRIATEGDSSETTSSFSNLSLDSSADSAGEASHHPAAPQSMAPGFIDQFDHMFRPLEELPLPEPSSGS